MPANSDKGLLTVQKGRSFTGGIKTALTKNLTDCFEKKNENHKLDFDPLLPKDVIKNAAKKVSILRVKFIHFGLPKDIADRYKGRIRTDGAAWKLVLKARRNSVLPLKEELMAFLSGDNKKVGQF